MNLPKALSLRKCIEVGVSIQYDEAATVSTREAVKGVLAAAFAAKPAAGASK